MAKITNKNQIGGSCRLPSTTDSSIQNSQLLEKNAEKSLKMKGDTVIGIDNKFSEFYNQSQKQSKNGKTNKIRSKIPSFVSCIFKFCIFRKLVIYYSEVIYFRK